MIKKFESILDLDWKLVRDILYLIKEEFYDGGVETKDIVEILRYRSYGRNKIRATINFLCKNKTLHEKKGVFRKSWFRYYFLGVDCEDLIRFFRRYGEWEEGTPSYKHIRRMLSR